MAMNNEVPSEVESDIVQTDVILNWLYYQLPDEEYAKFIEMWMVEAIAKGFYANEENINPYFSTLSPYEHSLNKVFDRKVPFLSQELLERFNREQGFMSMTDPGVPEKFNSLQLGVIRSCLLYRWHRNCLEISISSRGMREFPTNPIVVPHEPSNTDLLPAKAIPMLIEHMDDVSYPGQRIVQMPDIFGDTKFVEDKGFIVAQGSVFIYGVGDNRDLYAIGHLVRNLRFPEKLIHEPLQLMFIPQPPMSVTQDPYERYRSLEEIKAKKMCVDCNCPEDPCHARKSDTINGKYKFVEFPHREYASRMVCLGMGECFCCELGVYRAGKNVIRRTSCGIEVYEAVDIRDNSQ